MTTPASKPNTWMEPPEWWRKWRPLRWLAGALIVFGAYSWLKPLLPADVEPAASPAPPPAQAPASAAATPPAPQPAAAPVPAPAAATAVATTPAPAATTTAQPAPARFETEEEEEGLPPVAYQAYLAVPSDPVTLIAGMKSYSGVDEIFTELSKTGIEPEQQSFHSRVPQGVPPRELDLLRLKPYTHLGVEGTLELQFFNDRLYQAEFEPSDAETYRKAFRRTMPALERRRSGRSELRQGHLRVASSLDLSVSEVGQALRTRPYVIWQDTRLVQQRDAWDREFAKKAAP